LPFAFKIVFYFRRDGYLSQFWNITRFFCHVDNFLFLSPFGNLFVLLVPQYSSLSNGFQPIDDEANKLSH
jgi:hypothetical protein